MKMNVRVGRYFCTNLISYVRNTTLKRGLLTCHTNGRVKYQHDSLMAKLAFQDNSNMKFMDISHKEKIKQNPGWNRITDPAVVPNGDICIPINVIIHNFELPTSNCYELIEPVGNVVEKKAHRMMRIRKKKMKKHKWKKLQKKLKFIYVKLNRKRKAKKEAAFKEELKMILREGEAFDAEENLRKKIEILTWEKPINRVKGFFCPKWVVDQHLENEKKKKLLDDRIAICLKKMH